MTCSSISFLIRLGGCFFVWVFVLVFFGGGLVLVGFFVAFYF